MAAEDDNAEIRDSGADDEVAGERPDRPPQPYRPGPEDSFRVGVLVLIVGVLLLVFLLSDLDTDTGPATQDWNTVWH
ncbi:hypothetical protein [Streptomyces sp. NRRL B-24484]|uniref:hypothetical protein n=1 Tax=Streptomyces sp. NRRL B-24484 TaxID=1463833 RepID=UPI0004C13A6B|nr:hypothetical protein [Streptomyces sp. NRRL B-24484]